MRRCGGSPCGVTAVLVAVALFYEPVKNKAVAKTEEVKLPPKDVQKIDEKMAEPNMI